MEESARHLEECFPVSIYSRIFIPHKVQRGDAFASCFPGSLKAFEIGPGREMVFQKSAFLASEAGVELSVFFNKKFSSGLFGGEGFIMQKVTVRELYLLSLTDM